MQYFLFEFLVRLDVMAYTFRNETENAEQNADENVEHAADQLENIILDEVVIINAVGNVAYNGTDNAVAA